MPNIRMPDGAVVAFPDDMPQEKIKEMISSKFPQSPQAPQIGERAVPPPPPPPAPESAAFNEMGGVQPGAPRDSLAGYIPKTMEHKYGPSKAWRTVIDRAYNGATLANLGDEIQALGGAAVASPVILAQALMRDEGLKSALQQANPVDLYRSGLDIGRANRDAQFEESPVISTLAEIGGSLATGIPAAKAIAQTALGAKVASALGSGVLPNAATKLGKTANYASRIAAGGAVGGATAAAAGFGAGEGGIENRIEKAAEYAPTGAVLGAAFPVVADTVKSTFSGLKNVKRGMGSRTAEQLDAAVDIIREGSRASYKQMRDIGATIAPNRAVNIVNRVKIAMGDELPLNKNLHGKAMGLLDDFDEAARKKGFGLEDLEQWRKLFGRVAINKFNDPDNAFVATKAIRAIDDAVDNLGVIDLSRGGADAVEALKMGRSEWKRAAKFDTIADIIRKSDGDANYLKRELNKLVNNPRKSLGFNEDEIIALKNAATQSAGEGIMKALGKFGIDLGNSRLGNTALPVIGAFGAGATSGLGAGAAVPVAGTVARQMQKYLARGKAEQLLRVIEAGGKVAEKEVMKLPPPIAMLLMQNNLVATGRAPVR
jgi:hypothetical protein